MRKQRQLYGDKINGHIVVPLSKFKNDGGRDIYGPCELVRVEGQAQGVARVMIKAPREVFIWDEFREKAVVSPGMTVRVTPIAKRWGLHEQQSRQMVQHAWDSKDGIVRSLTNGNEAIITEKGRGVVGCDLPV